ncbi:NlpC/P60 family protein [Desulfonatronovibrio magnus]|uniref:NlpC/P60 family protein n=1 Tax=Desulfonatronovibrio magnus TaxID=698827 RepID=UPI0018DB22DD|nr:NlpC/P60 family protein [Desulfonatronovibrio magnus]
MKKFYIFTVLLASILILQACSKHSGTVPTRGPAPEREIARMQYSVQVGAFAVLDNAVRLMSQLERMGVEAYYFRDQDQLYKVRFGNYPSYQAARSNATNLQARGIISNFFIILPESYSVARIPRTGVNHVRQEIVRTAHSFIGVPYRWGGETRESGFDCSGLTMVVYRQNGLNLPRVSRYQFRAGRPVNLRSIQKGDLVFFATGSPGRVSHVGIYIGRNRFIHAPSTGSNVRIEQLSNPYFSSRFMGARTYL